MIFFFFHKKTNGKINKIQNWTFTVGSIVSLDIFEDYVPASVAQLDAPSYWRSGTCGFNLRRGQQHSFVEIDHEIGHSVPSADSRRAVVSFWRKNVHNTG